MDKNKAAGPDGLPIEFSMSVGLLSKRIYLSCLLISILGSWTKRINYGIITLLPKTKEASKIQ
jgi:hypothetical protein